MTWVIMVMIILGIITGTTGIFQGFLPYVDTIFTYALCLLLFSVGLDLGQNKEVWHKLWALGWRTLLVPLAIAVGSIAGALLMGTALKLPAHEAGAIGAGFGWYSLSGVLITQIYNIETGTMAFLANVFREIIAIILLPLLARSWGGFASFAPGGATTMDTTLPLVNRVLGGDKALVAFVSGTVLTALVPILVPFIINWR